MRIPCVFNFGNLGSTGDQPGLLIAVHEHERATVVNKDGDLYNVRTNQLRIRMGQPFTRSITAAVKS